MKMWDDVLVPETTSIFQAIESLDISAMKILLVVDEQRRLLGTITDGDVRRGILKGISLEEPVRTIMNPHPATSSPHDSREVILAKMHSKKILQIPILDDEGRVVGVEFLSELINSFYHDNWVVLMVGGLGTRLRPLTADCPKPMLRVGDKPLLETILDGFIAHGFRKFYLVVNYKAEMIMEYFGDGSAFGVEIRYIHEQVKMGTAGALSLIPEKVTAPLLVMNGDLLTKLNFNHLLDFHVENQAMATMCVMGYDYQVPFGVVNIDRQHLLGVIEKPRHRSFINAGIYVLSPEALEFIPPNTPFDMPTLFQRLIEFKQETLVFPIREYWLDIGRMSDFERAKLDFPKVFG